MTIRGNGTDETIHVTTYSNNDRIARVIVEAEGALTSISLDQNHLEALELACRAARLEWQARSIGP